MIGKAIPGGCSSLRTDNAGELIALESERVDDHCALLTLVAKGKLLLKG